MSKFIRLILALVVITLTGLAHLAQAEAPKVLTQVPGMHLPFPGIGHVRADGKGRYSWVPIEFGPLPKAQRESKAPGSN